MSSDREVVQAGKGSPMNWTPCVVRMEAGLFQRERPGHDNRKKQEAEVVVMNTPVIFFGSTRPRQRSGEADRFGGEEMKSESIFEQEI